MDSSIPRNTPALMARIDQLRNNLLKRFENLMELAAIDKKDRNTTALNQYQMQVETAALIRTSEEILAMTRQMQELWLFGQLKTLQSNEDVQTKIDNDAKEVADMLTHLLAAADNSSVTSSGEKIAAGNHEDVDRMEV